MQFANVQSFGLSAVAADESSSEQLDQHQLHHHLQHHVVVGVGGDGRSDCGGEFDTSAEEDRAAADTIDELNNRRGDVVTTPVVTVAEEATSDESPPATTTTAASLSSSSQHQRCDGAATDVVTAAADEENGGGSAGTPSIGYRSPAVDGAPVGRTSFGSEEEEPVAVDRLQQQPVHGTADERPTGNVYVRRDDMNYHHHHQHQHQQHDSPPQLHVSTSATTTTTSTTGVNNNNNSNSSGPSPNSRYDNMLVAQTYQQAKYGSGRDLMAAMFPQVLIAGQQHIHQHLQQRDEDEDFYEYQQQAYQQQQQQHTKFEHIVLKQEPLDRVQQVYTDEYFHQDHQQQLSVQLQQQQEQHCSSPGSSAGGYDEEVVVAAAAAAKGELLDLHLARSDGGAGPGQQENPFAHLVASLHSDSGSASPLQGHLHDDQQQDCGSPTIVCQQPHVADHSYTPSSAAADQQIPQHLSQNHHGVYHTSSNVIHHNSSNMSG
ncbi:hypothetical protein QTP88_008666 [Uroleucon formosanum]